MWRQLTHLKSLLVIWEILTLFVKTLTADDKYSLLNRYNFTQSDKYSLLIRNKSTQEIQMQLYQKQFFFSELFAWPLKSSWSFEHFKKQMTLIADVFPKLRTSKNVVRSMSKKSYFRGPYRKQDDKRVQTMLKLEPRHI